MSGTIEQAREWLAVHSGELVDCQAGCKITAEACARRISTHATNYRDDALRPMFMHCVGCSRFENRSSKRGTQRPTNWSQRFFNPTDKGVYRRDKR